MEDTEANKVTSETLSGVALPSQPSDELHKILKPSSENEVLRDDEMKGVLAAAAAGGDGVPVVVTKVVEKTEVTVVRVIQEDKDGNFENQETEEGIEQSVAEKNEGNEKEKEGVFGDCFGDDEGNMDNSSGNGTPVVVDVKSSLAGENGSEVKAVLEGCERDENVGGDSMDVSLFGRNDDEKEENAGQLDDSKGENDKDNGSELAENKEEYDAEQDDMEEEHDYVVGDFVWGKIKSHPWWPGLIYDPSDASDYAATLKRKGRLLVAYFGDGSFSWCSPAQLKPFIDCFQEMSVQSDSKKFVNAVEKALEAVSMLVEANLMCKCHTSDWVGNVGMVNSGIKRGVPLPKGNTIKVLIDQMQPDKIISILKDSATMEPGTIEFELELTVVKSWLSAFYRQKGGCVLPEYHDPLCIEGLEDEQRSGIRADSDINGPSESTEYGDDKLYQRRKQKSVAELLGDGVGVEDEPKVKKARTSKDGGSGGRSSSGVKRERKPKALVVSVVTPESDHESGGMEEETMSPRQRKKSKYLSPPYLSPVWPGKLSGSGSCSFKEPKTEPEKVPEMAAKQLEESSSFKRSNSGMKSRQRRRVREGSDSLDSKDEQNTIIDAAENVNKVLQALLTGALYPSSLAEKKNLPEIIKFISSFRSSVFEEGSGRKKDPSITLVIEFPPEAALPTKMELSRTYKKFGRLIKKEIQRDESRALVVFGNSSDAEAALVMSMEKKPFGEVEYYLSEEDLSTVEETWESEIAVIKQRLESMGEMVKSCEMSEEVKGSLEEGIKEVIEKVGKLREK